MQQFLQIALAFPTVVFTAVLLVLGLYWLLVILGALDLDTFDMSAHVNMHGHVDAHVHLDADVDPDGMLPGPDLIEAVMSALGMGTVPLTVILSFLTLTAWMVSFAAVYYLAPMIGGLTSLYAALFGVGSFVAALPVTMLIMQPFIQLFDTKGEKHGGESLIGSVCRVTTSRVDAKFGQADVDDGGAGLLLPVRCEAQNNGLSRGSKALIIDYDDEQHAYIVEPYDVLVGDDKKQHDGDAEAILDQKITAAAEEQEANEQQPESATSTHK